MEARLAALVRRDFSLQVQQAGRGEAGECIDPCLRRRNPSLNLSAKISVCGENLGKNLGGITNIGYMLKSRSNIRRDLGENLVMNLGFEIPKLK